MAKRIAISRCLAAERASNRLATLAQAIISTRPTAASMSIAPAVAAGSGRPKGDAGTSITRLVWLVGRLSLGGKARWICAASVFISASAASISVPAAKRPYTRQHTELRS